jgi:glycerophosphoryl diester phosphodiesterase
VNWTTPGLGLRIGGHRGAAAEAPENTLAGFERAAATGVDYVELDVMLTSDGVPVVFHDDELDRTTDGSGLLADHSSGDLRGLDAGGWFDARFSHEPIPTLDEFLAWLASRPGLGATLEAKGPGSGAAIGHAVAMAASRDHCSICSFSAPELRAAAEVEPTIPRLLILDRDRPDDDPIVSARHASATAVNVPFDWLSPADVARLHDAGLVVAGGTVDDEIGIARCLDLGIDVVDTNRPTITVPSLRRLARRPT